MYILMWCRTGFDLVRGQGGPVLVANSIEAIREWLTIDKNLRIATNTSSFQPMPTIKWVIMNEGALHYGRYFDTDINGNSGLLISPIHFI